VLLDPKVQLVLKEFKGQLVLVEIMVMRVLKDQLEFKDQLGQQDHREFKDSRV